MALRNGNHGYLPTRLNLSLRLQRSSALSESVTTTTRLTRIVPRAAGQSRHILPHRPRRRYHLCRTNIHAHTKTILTLDLIWQATRTTPSPRPNSTSAKRRIRLCEGACSVSSRSSKIQRKKSPQANRGCHLSRRTSALRLSILRLWKLMWRNDNESKRS